MISIIMHPVVWAVGACLLVFFPNETLEWLGLIDLRPGKWVTP